MKIKVIGKARLKGVSKKTGNPYDFIQVHYNGKACDMVPYKILNYATSQELFDWEITKLSAVSS